MAVPTEKATIVGETDFSTASTLNTHDVNQVTESDSEHPEKPIQSIPDDQYPHGVKLLLLTGASLVSVFLIALDQVRTSPTCTLSDTVKKTSDTTLLDHRWHSDS